MADGMRKIRWWMSIGLVGCKREGEMEVEDDLSDDDIYELIWDRATELVETGWEQIDG